MGPHHLMGLVGRVKEMGWELVRELELVQVLVLAQVLAPVPAPYTTNSRECNHDHGILQNNYLPTPFANLLHKNIAVDSNL